MTRTDCRGLAVTAASDAAVAAADRAIRSVLGHQNDTAAALADTLALDPDMPLPWLIKGFSSVIKGLRSAQPDGEAALDETRAALARVGGTVRERALADALALALAGQLEGAAQRIDAGLAARPRDALALKLSQALHFMLGDLTAMRARLQAALPAWSAGVPDYGYVLGCQAFVLEEIGEYDEAERIGRRGAALAPLDAWGRHAVAHVYETTSRPASGLAWFGEQSAELAHCNNFGHHLAWHRGLFWMALDRHEEALEVFDTELMPAIGPDYRDFVNAVSLLRLLDRAGVPVADRWQRLADLAEARIDDQLMVFSLLHHVVAFSAAGRTDLLRRLIEDEPMFGRDQAARYRMIGAPFVAALALAQQGRLGSAAERLVPLRHDLQRLGGSHAQRDFFHRILIESALSAGRADHVLRMLAERGRRRIVDEWQKQQLRRVRERGPILAASAA